MVGPPLDLCCIQIWRKSSTLYTPPAGPKICCQEITPEGKPESLSRQASQPPVVGQARARKKGDLNQTPRTPGTRRTHRSHLPDDRHHQPVGLGGTNLTLVRPVILQTDATPAADVSRSRDFSHIPW
jgi:hypothetical protein